MNIKTISLEEDLTKRISSLEETKSLDYIIHYGTRDNFLYIFGVDDKKHKYIKVKTEYGLFIGAKNLQSILPLLQDELILEIQEINTNELISTNNGVIDDFFNTSTKYKLFKLITASFQNSKILYYKLNKWQIQHQILMFAVVDLNLFVMLEFNTVNNTLDLSSLSKFNSYFVSCKCINEKLTFYSPDKVFDCDKIIFDIETVSPNKTRVPLGNHFSDVLFSVSILKEIDKKLHLICIVNLPAVTQDIEINKVYNISLESCETIIVNTEKDLLIKTMNYMRAENFSLIFGWNSASYDFPFLLYRLYYYQLYSYIDEFYTQDTMMSYGHQAIHLDYYIYIKKYYTFDNYKLGTVANDSLGFTKHDISAIHLRYVYAHFKNNNNINTIFNDGNRDYTIHDAIYYNNIDVILVYQLLYNNNSIQSIIDLGNMYNKNIIKIIMCQMFELLAVKLIKDGLQNNIILSFNHKHKILRIPNFGTFILNEHNITTRKQDGEGKFCGGFNYVDCKQFYEHLTALDYVAYYPSIMESNNLSYETVLILPANIVYYIFQIAPNKQNFKLYKFVDRRGDDQFLTQMVCRQLINGSRNSGDEIKSLQELKELGKTRVVIISYNKKGLFPLILENQNKIRTLCKTQKKKVDDILNEIIYIKSLINKKKPYKNKKKANINQLVSNYHFLQANFSVNYQEIKTIEEATKIELLLNGESNRLEGLFRAFKIENCSFFGLLGSETSIAYKIFAATITFLCAKKIIETSKLAIQLGGNVAFSDTDSTFIDEKNKNISDEIISIMRNRDSGLLLAKKTYDNVFIMAKKVYIGTYEGKVFSKGINKYGPQMWDTIMYNMYDLFVKINTNKSPTLYLDDIIPLFCNFYKIMYDIAKEDITKTKMTVHVKDLDEYKTKTATVKMMERALIKDPTLTFGNTVSFYTLFDSLVGTTYFELEEIYTPTYKEINFYKFASKPFTKIIAMANFILQNTYKQHNITRDFTHELKLKNKEAFMSVRKQILSS